MKNEFYKNFEFDKNKSVAQNIYLFLKEQIMSCNLKPKHKLSEKEVAERLEASRTPVRESFIRLKKEGLLEILPQRGTFVTKIDLKEVEEGLFIRRNLEKAMMRKAIEEDKGTLVRDLERCIKKQVEASEKDSRIEFLKYDNLFHETLYINCNMLKTWEVVLQSGRQYHRVRQLAMQEILEYPRLIKEHTNIVECIKKRKGLEAERLVEEHIKGIMVEEKILKKKYPNYFL